MDSSSRTLVNFLALASFLAGIFAALRGNFVYPVELALIALLGILLVMALALPKDDATSTFLVAVFFLAALANVGYMHSVAGYLSLARLGALGITLAGLAVSALSLLAQPVPPHLTSEAMKLIAAEKKIGAAKERLESMKEAMPKARKKTKRKKRK